MQRIGFIGVGTMGGPMARNLLKAGYALRVFDISPQACDTLAAAGGNAATAQLDVAAPTAAAARPLYERARNERRGRHNWTAIYSMLREQWRRKI